MVYEYIQECFEYFFPSHFSYAAKSDFEKNRKGKSCLDFSEQVGLGENIFLLGCCLQSDIHFAQISCKYQAVSVKCKWCLLWAGGTAMCCLLCEELCWSSRCTLFRSAHRIQLSWSQVDGEKPFHSQRQLCHLVASRAGVW